MFKKDSWVLGAVIGIMLPAATYGLTYLIMSMIGADNTNSMTTAGKYFKDSNVMLISIFMNLLPFRYYMVNLKFDKTGKGLLITTIIYAGVFFYLFL
jgi:hypothetical protein